MSDAPREPWERMLSYVHQLVRADPWARDREHIVTTAGLKDLAGVRQRLGALIPPRFSPPPRSPVTASNRGF